tara:strand:+ start:13041 stop:13658 length:618 start_codon:yes stop_codon:yes gene_type:complete
MNEIDDIEETNLFNQLLAKAVSEESEIENEDICFITNEKLEENYIKLPCNHTFNYMALYNEIINQKNNWTKIKNISHLESHKLRAYQMKCPYCRTIYDGILPYVNIDGVKRMKYVNSPNSKCIKLNSCNYVFKKGKRKEEKCGKNCINEYCEWHKKIINKHKCITVCKHVLLKGSRKGECCGKKCSKGKNYCRNHIVKYTNQENK